jgi:putative NADH-flavin reductase
MYEKQQPAAARDREQQEMLIEASGLDWTIVKPPRLSDGPGRGRYRSGEDLGVGAFSHISRADLSAFILTQLDSDEYLKKRAVIQY